MLECLRTGRLKLEARSEKKFKPPIHHTVKWKYEQIEARSKKLEAGRNSSVKHQASSI